MHEFETLLRRLSEGRIGRRDFIKRATALGLAAAVPTALLAEEAKAAAPKSHTPRCIVGMTTPLPEFTASSSSVHCEKARR